MSRRRLVALLLLMVLAPLAAPTAANAATAPKSRAMWLWQQAPVDQVVGWATAHQVRELFVSFPPNTTDLCWYKQLKAGADAAHLTLSALGGDASWALNPAAATQWVGAVKKTGLFAGLHVDVEPYVLPAWNTNRNALVTGYLALLNQLRGSGLPLELDVPFWYATVAVPGGGNLADAVLARVNRLTVMTYRNTTTGPNSLMDVAHDMLTRAKAGASIRLAIETQPLGDCKYCTYAGRTQATVTGALADIDRLAGGYPAFTGVAVHHFQAWRALAG
jgi:hypothetical protein